MTENTYVTQVDDLLDAFASDPEVSDADYYTGLTDLHKRIGESLGRRRLAPQAPQAPQASPSGHQAEQDWSRFDMEKAFAHVLNDVDADIRNDSMPWNVNTWNDMTGFVDPNEYLISAVEAQGFKVQVTSPESCEVVNELLNRIDSHLTERDAEVVLEGPVGDVRVLHVPWLTVDPWVIQWTSPAGDLWTPPDRDRTICRRAPDLPVATAFLAALFANGEEAILRDELNIIAAEFIGKTLT